MTESISVPKNRKVKFWLILFVTLLPVIVLPMMSIYYHEIFNVPTVREGILDLKDVDLSKAGQISLDGEWEFYRDQWILTEGMPSSPGQLVPVPQLWVRYNVDGVPLNNTGKGSYRLIIKNCPTDIKILSYIPNISSRYRVYMNGTLVAGRGDMDIEIPQAKKKDSYKIYYGSTHIEKNSDIELIIEILSPHIGGLYLTPVLASAEADHIYRDLRRIFAAMLMGVLFVTIMYIAFIWFWKDKSLQPIALLVIDIIVCIRTLVRDEFFEVMRQILPVFRYYIVNSSLQIITFLLPIIFLFCVRQLVNLKVSRQMILYTVIYELLLSVMMFWCVYNGRPDLQLFICFVSYLPFVVVIYQLYFSAVQGSPYTLMVLAILTLTITSILASALNDFGFLVFNVSLFAPGCFVVSAILQLVLYIRRNIQVQEQALEVENLRLKLRDSQVSLMLSQIRPHFLYNTLIAIHMLCMEAPALAAETVMKFAIFLRTNMRFIRSREPIAFEQEFLHIKNYVDIEKLRFQKRLQVHYDVQVTNFMIPALAIQPLVENAIRHGASKNIGGGTVTLKTFDCGEYNCVEITDDGPGFDTSILDQNKESSFGLRNIIFRLKEQVQAKIEFISKEGNGTMVRICLPKEESK